MIKLKIFIILLIILSCSNPKLIQKQLMRDCNTEFIGLWCNENHWFLFEDELKFYIGEDNIVTSYGKWYAESDTNLVVFLFHDGTKLYGYYEIRNDVLYMLLYYNNIEIKYRYERCKKPGNLKRRELM